MPILAIERHRWFGDQLTLHITNSWDKLHYESLMASPSAEVRSGDDTRELAKEYLADHPELEVYDVLFNLPSTYGRETL